MYARRLDILASREGLPLPVLGDPPVVTYAVLAINVLVWGVSSLAGARSDTRALLDFGAMFGPLIADGQYWRLFTAMFVHVGLWHIFFNSFALLIFGRLVERYYGHFRFIAIYVLAGLAGSVASYLMNSIGIAAGASGAIFGVLGALAAFFLTQRRVLGKMAQRSLYGLLIIAAINLFIGVTVPGIDNWAHMGGFVAGFFIGLALAPKYRYTTTPQGYLSGLVDAGSLARRWVVLPVAAVVLLAGTWLGTATLPDNAISHVYEAERLFAQEEYVEALDETRLALTLDPLEPEAYLLRGKVFTALDDLGNARTSLGLAIQAARRIGDTKVADEAQRLLVELISF